MSTNNNLINIALKEYGITEVKGDTHHPRILQYFSEIGKKWVKDDETAWCSAFANWVALKACCQMSGELTARSWLTIGQEVKNPEVGDIVVYWRESKASWKGHVGFYIGHSPNLKQIYTLGGNQNNQVNISPYPAYRKLQYRRLQLDWEMK